MTINLKNRKKLDFNLIAGAAKKKPRTFTELLQITKLSRKTLSLRLGEMCEKGTLVKDAGVYKVNGAQELEKNARNLSKGFSRVFNDRRTRTCIMLIAFLICSSASGYVLAMFLAPSESGARVPVIVGDFTMALDVSNVKDLYAWQVVITFNSSELEVIGTIPGGFVGEQYPLFVTATDLGEGTLLAGGTLSGMVPGRSGSGRLASIVFGYFTEGYELPRIVPEIRSFETQLWDSNGSIITIEGSTLTLITIENP